MSRCRCERIYVFFIYTVKIAWLKGNHESLARSQPLEAMRIQTQMAFTSQFRDIAADSSRSFLRERHILGAYTEQLTAEKMA